MPYPNTITFIISNDFPEGLAKSMRIRAYARGLKELGEKVEVWSGYSSSFNQNRLNTQVKGEWNGVPFLQLSGTQVYRSQKWFKLLIWLRANIYLLWLLFKLRKEKRTYIAYSPQPSGMLYAIRLAKRMFGQEFIFIETELASKLEMRQAVIQHGANVETLSNLEGLKKSLAKQIWVVSPYLENAYNQLEGEAKVERIAPVVVEMDHFERMRLKESFTLGYAGTFGDKDGISTLLKAFELAKKAHPKLRLKLMGKAEIAPDPLPDGAFMTGPFLYQDYPELLSECDTLIVNRKNDDYSKHGFPFKLAEYTATGIPVLLCDFPFYHEFFSENEVWYFEPDHFELLAQAICNRYAHGALSIQKAQAAKVKSAHFFSHIEAAKELKRKLEHMA